jgi:phosphate:Na+ symporter
MLAVRARRRAPGCYRSQVSASAVGTLIGGIGLFLLGMGLMTDGLTSLGSQTLRRLLGRLTRHKFLGLLTGAGFTAAVQSSSVTTLVTIGFVSAGLLTFSQSLGVVFGANIGTTSTAWIVALVGLKVDVSAVALPLIGFGAFLRLVTRGRRARMALALAGFGLVFVGIDVMQAGMANVDIDLGRYDEADGVLASIALVVTGIIMTVVLQSSSAAVTMTLVALHADTISLWQAGALVIGQNVGTSVKAILGSIGGTLAAKRTAVAHILFNLVTGALAIALLAPFISLVRFVGGDFVRDSPEGALALFHTAFNVLGVAIFYPLTEPFGRAVERLVRDREVPVLQRLSRSALSMPAVALEGARVAVAHTALEAMRLCVDALRSVTVQPGNGPFVDRAKRIITDPRSITRRDDEATRFATRLASLRATIDATSSYLAKIRTSDQATSLRDEHVELLHAVDHLRRLVLAAENEEMLDTARGDRKLRQLAAAILNELTPLVDSLPTDPALEDIRSLSDALEIAAEREEHRREAYRAIVLSRTADGELSPFDAERLLQTSRWLGKFTRHPRRTFLHLAWNSESPPLPLEAED